MKRKCEICESKQFDILHTQKFILENNYLFSYEVVTCKKCGFVFASNLPTIKKLEKFYKKNTKYAYKHHQGELPNDAKKLHSESFKMVDLYLRKNISDFNRSTMKILDIGSATGYLLNIFKKNGYKNLLGIDPSPECGIVAKKIYGIKVLPFTLSEYKTKEKFDLIILGSVMEHLNDLENNLSKIAYLLKENGIIFVSVPDGNNFGKIFREPFLEFSLEHINFFTKNSLINLFSKYGLKNIKFSSLALNSYGGYALNSLWLKSRSTKKITYDKIGKMKIISYIKKSSKKLENINKKIKKLVKSREEMVIWGLGSLTSRLLATTELKKANIKFFVDSNTNQQGKLINNLRVKSPDVLRKLNITVFISTYIYGKEIKNILIKQYNFKGKIILL